MTDVILNYDYVNDSDDDMLIIMIIIMMIQPKRMLMVKMIIMIMMEMIMIMAIMLMMIMMLANNNRCDVTILRWIIVAFTAADNDNKKWSINDDDCDDKMDYDADCKAHDDNGDNNDNNHNVE